MKKAMKVGARRPNMTGTEADLARKMYHQQGKKPSEIAKVFDRDHSTITRLLFIRKKAMKAGRPHTLSKIQVDNLVKRLGEMVKAAGGKKEVTVCMLKKRTKCKACTKTILKELHGRKIYFRKLREKPMLTDEDQKERLKFAKKYSSPSAKCAYVVGVRATPVSITATAGHRLDDGQAVVMVIGPPERQLLRHEGTRRRARAGGTPTSASSST